jgi:Tol biopolymer transport system component
MKKILLFIFIIFSSKVLFAQFTNFHPELNWYTIKGKHVEVHYHQGTERTARVVAKIADEVWGPLTSLYQYDPGIVHFVIKDIDDYSNGATYFFDNKIEIWTSALDFDLRGTHNWLRNVISHEFTHMIQIQAAMKTTRSIPAVFLQMLNYEDVRRPDILYGFPNFIFSYPIASVNIPAWFAEGTAQYMRKDFLYDRWDTHRDMILRCYALDNKMLTWNEMSSFGKTSLGNESVYNAGFALTRYISQKYGEEKLREITHDLGKLGNFTIDAAIDDAIGKSGNDLYNEWKDFLMKNYKQRSQKVLSNLVEGDTLAKIGFGNFYPVFSKDGSKFIYISNKNSDYFSPAGIYLYDLKTKKEKLLVNGVRSTIGWIPGQNKIVYAKLTEDNPNRINIHDLYIYDIDKDKETRITFGLRANQPAVSHDGKKIIFLFEKDGTTNLGIVDIDGKNFKKLTNFANGEQVYSPKFSNDDSFIVFGYSLREGRDIARIDTNGANYGFIIRTKADERNPVFDPNGNLIYASDTTGIFNIYSYNLGTKQSEQLTNVIGGAFMPDMDKDGNLIYAGYTYDGYKIFYITPEQQKKVITRDDYVWINDPPLDHDKPLGDMKNFDLAHLQNYNDFVTPNYDPKSYKGEFTRLTLYPFIRFDNYTTTSKFLEKIKPGLIVSSSDMLDRYDIYAGGSIDARAERDLFLIMDYRNKLPLLFDLGLKPELSLELYNISRKANVDVLFGVDSTYNPPRADYTIPTDVSYNLLELDLIAKHRIFSRGNDLQFKFTFSRYTSTLDAFLLPDNTLYPTTNDTYFIGRDFQAKYTYQAFLPYRDDEINPIGMKFVLAYDYQWNKFNNQGNYVVEDGLLKPLYNSFDFHQLELNSRVALPLINTNTITTQIRLASIIGSSMPDFFDFYLGGLPGMKAYPFYAISGNKLAWLNLTYRFPLFRNIDLRLGHLYLDKIFFSVFGDVGDAWTGYNPKLKDFKKGAGAEMRIQLNSYYLFPTDVFFSAAYGFDKFDRIINNKLITYGKEWRFYGGVTFGFDFDFSSSRFDRKLF